MLYEFTEFHLDYYEFINLVFMNAPDWWESDPDHHDLLLNLCGKSLYQVVKRIKKEVGTIEPEPDQEIVYPNHIEIFNKLQHIVAKKKNGELEDEPWFNSHFDISKNFDLNIMPPIWIRNLTGDLGRDKLSEREKCQRGSYYIEDGCTRALIYAMKILKDPNPQTKFQGFPVIHATSWEMASGYLERLPQKADVLENKGVFQYNRTFKESIRLPIGIGIDWYQGESRSLKFDVSNLATKVKKD